MRLILASLVAALVLAGCANNATPGPTTTTPTTPTPGGGSGNGTMSMSELAKDNHDFTTDAAAGTPAGGAASKAFTIPAGATMLNLTVRFTPASGAPAAVAQGVTVKAGGLTCTLPDGPVTAPLTCTKEGAATPGDAKIEYAGAGPVTATVTVSGG